MLAGKYFLSILAASVGYQTFSRKKTNKYDILHSAQWVAHNARKLMANFIQITEMSRRINTNLMFFLFKSTAFELCNLHLQK